MSLRLFAAARPFCSECGGLSPLPSGPCQGWEAVCRDRARFNERPTFIRKRMNWRVFRTLSAANGKTAPALVSSGGAGILPVQSAVAETSTTMKSALRHLPFGGGRRSADDQDQCRMVSGERFSPRPSQPRRVRRRSDRRGRLRLWSPRERELRRVRRQSAPP